MQEGEIAYLGKGFGFLKIKDREKDLFFHATGLVGDTRFEDLKVQDKVSFKDIVNTGRGPIATGVELA